MSTVPRWYWPIACLPGVIAILLGILVIRDQAGEAVEKLKAHSDRLGMIFSLYVALILLGYLLLVLCRPSRSEQKSAAASRATSRE